MALKQASKVRKARVKLTRDPEPAQQALARFSTPSEAEPVELAIAGAAGHFLRVLGRLPETNDFIERALVACRGLLIWPAGLVAAMQTGMGAAQAASAAQSLYNGDDDDDNEAASLGSSEQLRWQSLVDPDRVHTVRPIIFRKLNADSGLRRALGLATIKWAASEPTSPIPELANARHMAEAFGLGDEGRRLIELIILAELSYDFEDALTQLELGKRHELERILGLYLDCDKRIVAKLLAHDGPLVRIGLIEGDDGSNANVGTLLVNSGSIFAQALRECHASTEDFLASFLMQSPAPKLDEADTAHLAAIKQLATPLLRSAAEQAVSGVNLMFYGPPGTGKTELARHIAMRAGLRLYEVRFASSDASSLSAKQRLASLLLTLHALKGRRDAAILLDEAEDIFSSCERGFWAPPSKDNDLSKAWITRLLEENQIPVLWTSNRVRQIDPAVLRRFSVMYEFTELPQSVKRRLADKFLGEMALGEQRLDQVASLRSLVPAQVENARDAVALAKPATQEEAWQFVRLQLNESRRSMGQAALAESAGSSVPYVADCLNLGGGMSAAQLLEGLRRNGRAALCFHGMPGTGKTELARYLARQLDRELVVQSGSDLLSMWVGDTERKIADMFGRAGDRARQVVLLLDEADTFLKDRSKATASWELSQTNEFLARMEGFPGIFICTTNLIDRLDAAVLRRFQFRVEFLGLKIDQALRLFQSAFGRSPSDAESRTLRQLGGKIVPADFSNVAKQLAFLGSTSEETEVTSLLVRECQARGVAAASSRAIGFVH